MRKDAQLYSSGEEVLHYKITHTPSQNKRCTFSSLSGIANVSVDRSLNSLGFEYTLTGIHLLNPIKAKLSKAEESCL